MVVAARRRQIAFFIALGSCLVALAVALNVGWIIISWRTGALLVLGILVSSLIITGVVLNTIFLVREIRRNEQHDAFINAVTHELKTPVASMRLYLQTLQSREIDDVKRREFYISMLADCDRLTGTIEQVLHAGRTASHKNLQQRVPVNLRDLVSDCVTLARSRHHLGEDSVRFVDGVNGSSTAVIGDASELKAAVSNLIENAIKYSGANVDVEVAVAHSEPGRIAVRVSDRGVGIPPDELKRIWKRFYRIPGAVAARVKGTGLGLFIVRSIAKKHGGRAWAESQGAGHGSTFTIQLPAAPSA
ncbi:MAG TPA: HAMP domain-containing sensor histidine kinase [Bryobacteraceae bacterium]|nr:HAMP domain-containing sensor histidine kinase [Bryobacteraceae bacterium]